MENTVIYVGDLWSVLTAIGTVGAIVVSLWLVRKDDRAKQRERLQRAFFQSRRVLIPLKTALIELKEINNAASYPDNWCPEEGENGKLGRVIFSYQPSRMLKENLTISADVMLDFLPIGNDCATRLAVILSAIKSLAYPRKGNEERFYFYENQNALQGCIADLEKIIEDIERFHP